MKSSSEIVLGMTDHQCEPPDRGSDPYPKIPDLYLEIGDLHQEDLALSQKTHQLCRPYIKTTLQINGRGARGNKGEPKSHENTILDEKCENIQ